MTETNPGELPLATAPGTPQIDPAPQPSTALPELADIIASGEDAVVMRVATVAAVEVTGNRRVQLDIAATTWVNRIQDCQLTVGDRVSVLQTGPVMLVIGRLTGTDAFTPIGGVLPYAGSSAPTNWLLCDGSSVLRATYPALFAICGTTYGSVDGTHFNLPDLRNRLPMGAGGTFSRGSTGSGSVTLSTTHLPGHTHSFADTSDTQGSHGHSMSGSTDSAGSHAHSEDGTTTRSDILAGGGTTAALPSGGTTGSAGSHSHSISASIGSAGGHAHSISGTTGSAGSGGAFSTTGPYQALSYIIRAQ
jgi:microcystin-dependent protein